MGIYVLSFGVLANIVGTIPYIIGTLQGSTKPNKISWFFWTLAPGIAAFSSYAAGAGLASIPAFCGAALCAVVLLLSFFNRAAYWRLEAFDYACGALALFGLVLWYTPSNPLLALGFAIAADISASIPTVRKAWTHPETESPWTYAGGFLNGFGGLFVLPALNFASLGFPITTVIIESTILSALFYRNKSN